MVVGLQPLHVLTDPSPLANLLPPFWQLWGDSFDKLP